MMRPRACARASSYIIATDSGRAGRAGKLTHATPTICFFDGLEVCMEASVLHGSRSIIYKVHSSFGMMMGATTRSR